MNLTDSGLAFIARWEGVRLTLYNDDWKPSAVSQGNCTIGVGHLVHLGPIDGRPEEAPFANGISYEQAMALFRIDVQVRVDQVLALTPRLNANELAAMVDFAYNCGIGAYAAHVAPVVNWGGDVCAAIAPFIEPDWATEALKDRRAAESRLFSTPVEEDEMWKRFNGVAAWWVDRTLFPGPAGTMQLSTDFPQLPQCKAVDLDVYLSPASQGGLIIKDGDGAFAGKVTPASPHQVIRAIPGWTRQLLFEVEGPLATVETMGVVGYLA